MMYNGRPHMTFGRNPASSFPLLFICDSVYFKPVQVKPVIKLEMFASVLHNIS